MFLLVDNNPTKNSEKLKIILENRLSEEVRIAMNSGHALVCLDHLHLSQKINTIELVVILNMDTPISGGFEFLMAYKNSHKYRKEKIQVIVVDENLTEEKKEKIKSFGVSDFICDAFPIQDLKTILEKRSFSTTEINSDIRLKKNKVRSKSKNGKIICT